MVKIKIVHHLGLQRKKIDYGEMRSVLYKIDENTTQ